MTVVMTDKICIGNFVFIEIIDPQVEIFDLCERCNLSDVRCSDIDPDNKCNAGRCGYFMAKDEYGVVE